MVKYMSYKIAVLASGNGSNFEALVKAQESFDGTINLLVVNKPDAYAIERAKRLGVNYIVLETSKYASREDYDRALVELLLDNDIYLVLLAGFMRILSPYIVNKFASRIINIHPSLLPKYPGVAAIDQALEAGDDQTGVSVHYVTEGLDSGEVILQEKVTIEVNETLDSLTRKVHQLEHELYPKAVKIVIDKLSRTI